MDSNGWKEIRLGLMVYGTTTGLGNQTKAYYDNLRPSVILGVDISKHNQKKVNKSWYPATTRWTNGFPSKEDCEYLVDRSDVILVAETPLNYYLFDYAKKQGVKVILHYNYEFLDYLQNPGLTFPDVLLSPSRWYLQEVMEQFSDRARVGYLPFPVDTNAIKFREIKQIKHFVHVAGGVLHEDRNGTELVLKAIPYVKSDVKFTIYSQHKLAGIYDLRVEVKEMDLPNYTDLYKKGECLILPRRYGGQTLQMNEAMAAGMIPIMLDCPPNDIVLAKQMLVPAKIVKKTMTRTMINVYGADPKDLASKIDEYANLPEAHVQSLNRFSEVYSDKISWSQLKNEYWDLFREAVSTRP